MGLSPRAIEVLAAVNACVPPIETLDPVEARQMMVDKRRRAAPPPTVEVGSVDDVELPTVAGAVRARMYRPRGEGIKPITVFLHGGGWVLCDLDSHDSICRRLCTGADCIVISVDYRLAPEHPFPAGLDDAFAVTTWVADHADELGAIGGALAVAGDSAGGNLAAAMTLLAREHGRPRLAYQVLVYPVTDCDFTTGSYREFGEGNLTTAAMRWYWSLYMAGADPTTPLASPLRAEDLAGLPPALVVTAEADALRDEGEAYAARLRDAGVDVRSIRYAGMFHGFLGYWPVIDEADAALDEISSALHVALHERR